MPAGQQLSAFDVPPGKAGRFCVYHDESGTDTTHDRFQLHGALLVEDSMRHNPVGIRERLVARCNNLRS